MPIELDILSLTMMARLMDKPIDYIKERTYSFQEMQLHRAKSLEHNEHAQPKQVDKAHVELKDKGRRNGDLVLRNNSKLKNTFQRMFQIKWKGPFRVLNQFCNDTYKLIHMENFIQGARVNGSRLKKYLAGIIMFVVDVPKDGS